MLELIRSIHSDQRGQGMAEYGLIIALVAVAAIVAFRLLGTGIFNKVTEAKDALN
ncbi:MAG: Flp family type IVb pilin [Firmicutes bacterium]|nr:Flp family type IVb pilin [Bacillota bacterium]MCL5057224.1 Flp family type IVb pilin [Actinomycetota bacterium]